MEQKEIEQMFENLMFLIQNDQIFVDNIRRSGWEDIDDLKDKIKERLSYG